MDISNQVASIQNGLHTALGAVGCFADILKDHQSLTKSPKYVEQASGQAFNQPYEIKGTKMYGFVIEGSMAKLQDICDKFLNNPNNGHIEYRPASPYILLTFNNIDSLSSICAPDHEKGTVTEKEVVFWMLTVVGKRVGPLFIAERLATFIPYIYVDNPITLISGREVQGFFKQLGKFQIPDNIQQKPDLLTADTLVFPQFTPETQALDARLLEVQRIASGEDHESIRIWGSYKEAIREIVGLTHGQNRSITIPSIELPFNLLDYLIEKIVPLVTLKQIRDVEDSRQACYQALIESPMQVQTFHYGRLLGFDEFGDQFELKINNFANQPIVQDLGLGRGYAPGSDSIHIRVKLSFLLHFDFTLKNGVTVWQASQK